MIMEKVRSVTKYFLWFAAAAFVFSMAIGFGTTMFWKGSGEKENIIAKVDDETITTREYGNLLKVELQRIRGAMGTDPIRERQTSEAAINQLITRKIINDLLEKRKISISDEQLIDIIRGNPPPEITQNPDFWIDGQFDYNRYYALLGDPRADQFIRSYASQIAENFPMAILRGEILSTVRITSGNAIEKLLEDSVKVKIEYIKLSLKEWKNPETSISLEDFYSEHKEMFRRDRFVKLGYVFFPVSVNNEMIQTTKDLAGSIIERAKTDSFELLMGQYSYFPDDRSLFNGWVKTKSLTYQFATAIAGMGKGKVSAPIKSDMGFHILKLRDRRRDSVNIAEILLPVFPSFEEFQNVSTKGWKLVKKLRNSPDSSISEKYNAKYISYGKGDFPSLPVNFAAFLVDPKEGDISYPLIGEGGFYVFWVEEKEEGIPPFSEIEAEVKDSLINFEAALRAKNYALKNFSGDKLPRKPEKGKWGKTSYFTLSSYAKYNVPEKVALLSFYVRKDGILPPVRVGESLFIVKTIDFKIPGSEKLQELIPALAIQLQQSKESLYFEKWFSGQRKQYNVEDLRERLYE